LVFAGAYLRNGRFASYTKKADAVILQQAV
jgi:hypothetical protein